MGYITRLRKRRSQVVNISANAAKLCEEKGIDPKELIGTGQKGKITVTDVKKAIAQQSTSVGAFDEEE